MQAPSITTAQAIELANTLRVSGQQDAAETLFRRITEYDPTCYEAWNNLGSMLVERHCLEEGVECLRKALSFSPENPLIRVNLAIPLFAMGQYEEAWTHHEWRLKGRDFTELSKFPMPLWNGVPMPGKRLLAYAEQGLGDTIHFFRYLSQIQDRSRASVVFACAPALVRLLRDNAPAGVEVVPHRSFLPQADAYLPLLSSPFALRCWDPMEGNAPYLASIPHLAGNVPRVGLAWQGSRDNPRDWQRSINPQFLLPLLELPGVEFHSLQVGSQFQHRNLIDRTVQLADFSDTAALMSQLDLIITADTSVAHLAGAMGKPIWTLLPFSPDWRWGIEGETTPWYPTMRLFRQKTIGDWQGVIQRVTEALALARKGK